MHLNQIVNCGTTRRKQLVVDRLEMFANDIKTGFGKEMMDIGNPSGDRIFNRHHRQMRVAILNSQQHVLKRPAGHWCHLRLDRQTCHVGIGAKAALKRYLVGRIIHDSVSISQGSPAVIRPAPCCAAVSRCWQPLSTLGGWSL
jgi:hypothetical protein